MLEYLFVTVRAMGYGIAIGIAAGLGSFVGKRMLGHMDNKTFRRIVIVVMVVSGIALIYRQLFGENS